MSFKRRTGDDGGETAGEEAMEDENTPTAPVLPAPVPTPGRIPVPPAPVFNIARARSGSETVTVGSSIPDSEGDSVLADSPKRSSKTTTTRAPSLADSVDRAVGSKLKNLGIAPTFGNSPEEFPPLPPQKLKD